MGQSTTGMTTLCKIIILVFFTFSGGEITHDIQNMKEMMRDMNHRVSKAEEKLAKTEEKLKATEYQLAEALKSLGAALNELAEAQRETQTELLTTKNDLVAKDKSLDTEITRIRNPPYMHVCGAHYRSVSLVSKTITYSSLLYSSTNTDGGGLDLQSGVFTSSWPGSYTVTWSMNADIEHGEKMVKVILQRNGKEITESKHMSYYSGSSGGIYDQGGRTIVLLLDMGDTLQLYCL